MCAICSRKYKHIKELIDHDQLMHSKSLIYCEICFESNKSRQDLYEHYKQVHLTEVPSFKQARKQSTESNSEISIPQETIHLLNHEIESIKVRNQNEPSNISIEQNQIATFLTPQDQGKITKTSKNQPNSSLNDENWGKVQKNDLIRGLLDRKHQCKWCSLRFYTKSQLKQHEASHTNSVLYCPVCDKQFTHKDRLSGHMKCHMEPSLECKVCGKKFKRLCNLYNHELVHGLTEHAFMLCQFCGRGFRSRRDYQNHVIANHRELLMKTDVNKNNIDIDGKQGEQRMGIQRRSNNSRRSTKFNNNDTHNPEMMNNDENNKNLNMVDIESETYFTRTETSVRFQSLDEDDDDDEEESNENIYESGYINEQTGHLDTGVKIFKRKNSLRNKIKRLKTSLDIEVIDDEEQFGSVYLNNRLLLEQPIDPRYNHYANGRIIHGISMEERQRSEQGVLVNMDDEVLA